MENNKQVLQLKNIPLTLIDTKWEDLHLYSPAKFNRLAIELSEGNKTVFLHGDKGAILDRLIEDETKSPSDIYGIDYPKYFSAVFDGGNGTVKSNVLYIYDVGEELANSTNYSDKVLSNLIKLNKANGNTTIICSDIYATSLFKRNYPLASGLIDDFLQITR